MEQDYEQEYHHGETAHWWFRGRRNALTTLLGRFGVADDATIVEIGCSSGRLLGELRAQGFRYVTGVDVSLVAARRASADGLSVALCDGAQLAFAERRFSVLVASDCLEHIRDDQQALREWYRVVKPGGLAIVFVPAFAFLWGHHDVVNHHFRRYTVGALRHKLQGAGWHVEASGYWNSLLLPATGVLRRGRRLLGLRPSSQRLLAIPPSPINRALEALLRWENRRLGAMPFGVSAFAVARR